MSLSRQISNLDDKSEFHSNLYKNIEPETAKTIIAATHCPNHAMPDIITAVNRPPMNFLIRNEIDKDPMTFEDTYRGCECIFSSTVTLFYTRHTVHLLNVCQILLPFGLYKAFLLSLNNV